MRTERTARGQLDLETEMRQMRPPRDPPLGGDQQGPEDREAPLRAARRGGRACDQVDPHPDQRVIDQLRQGPQHRHGRATEAKGQACDECGLTLRAVPQGLAAWLPGLLPRVRAAALSNLLERAHEGGTHHIGKVPRRAGAGEQRQAHTDADAQAAQRRGDRRGLRTRRTVCVTTSAGSRGN